MVGLGFFLIKVSLVRNHPKPTNFYDLNSFLWDGCEFKPIYLEPLPIPDTSYKDKQTFAYLAQQAAQSEGSKLEAIQDKINLIVYQLFNLATIEIQLIEDTISQ